MIESLKTIERERVNTVNPVDPTLKMTDVIREYSAHMDALTEMLYSSARLLVGENMKFSPVDFPAPGCLMEDVKLLGEKLTKITELCDIIGGCL